MKYNVEMTNYELLQQLIATDTDDCIIWPRKLTRKGYGQVSKDCKTYNANRIALHMAKGAPPHPSMQACHGECHNRACVNPKHLSWQTNAQNAQDRKRDGTSRGPKAKLTFEQAEDIRLKYVTGEYSMRELGDEYGVNPGAIHHIVEHETYIY